MQFIPLNRHFKNQIKIVDKLGMIGRSWSSPMAGLVLACSEVGQSWSEWYQVSRSKYQV